MTKIKQEVAKFVHPLMLTFNYPPVTDAGPAELKMKKAKKRKLFYCKRCTGKFSKHFVKRMDGYYICLTCAGIEEYLNSVSFSDYPFNGGRYKVRE